MQYTESECWGFRRLDFEFRGRVAMVILPAEGTSNGKGVIKTEYFGAFPATQIEMLKRGYTFCFNENRNRWGTREDLEDKYDFIRFVAEEFHLDPKFSMIGMSCGGMYAIKLTALHPDCASVLYLDAPVIDFLSCPCGMGIAELPESMFEEIHRAYGMTRSQLLSYREHPLDKLPDLIRHDIPVVLVYGDADKTVPYVENGALLEAYYKAHGGKLLAIGKPGCDHHPHGLEDPTPVLDFIDQYA